MLIKLRKTHYSSFAKLLPFERRPYDSKVGRKLENLPHYKLFLPKYFDLTYFIWVSGDID
jgi:hypothetical protein